MKLNFSTHPGISNHLMGGRFRPSLAVRPIFFVVGVNHRSARLSVQESVCVHENEVPVLFDELKKTAAECVIVSTCNRTEVYGVMRDSEPDLNFFKDLLIDFKTAGSVAKREHFYALGDEEAFRHLFRVAASIDSKIIGDGQILGQLRRAYALANEFGATGKITNRLFQRAFKLGKQVRSETDLHNGAVSLGLAAVELAAKTLGSLGNKTALIIGAGETARLTAECLVKKGLGRILLANRTRPRAEELISSLRLKSHGFTSDVIDFVDLKYQLNQTDIVIGATSSKRPILSKKDFASQRRKVLVIDIAMPRDIAPDVSEHEKVTLKNLGDLHALADHNYRRRMAELPGVDRLINAELADFLDWYHFSYFQIGCKGVRSERDRQLGNIAEMRAAAYSAGF